MLTETAMGAAMKRAGVPVGQARLFTTAAEVLRNGRNFEAALAAFVIRLKVDGDLLAELAREYLEERRSDMDAEKLRDGGRRPFAEKAGERAPSVSRPNDDRKGRGNIAEKAGISAPAPSSTERSGGYAASAGKAYTDVPHAATERNGAGHFSAADKAGLQVPAPVSPAIAKRSGATLLSIAKEISKSLFDTFRLPDGRAFGDVPHSELPRVAKEHRRISRVAMLAYNYGVPADPNARVRDFMKETDFAGMVEQAEKFNDIA